MKAAVVAQPGGASVIHLEERPVPKATEGNILIKVKAFGLNRSEIITRKGQSPSVYFPRVLGIECVGEVEEDPSGGYQKGQKVAALMGGMGRDFDGGYAEYALLPKKIVFPFQSDLGWDQLGAVPEMFQTVYGSLQLALEIKEGETLLIRGGSSSIGMLACQFAKYYGLTVVSTTRNPEKEERLRDNGAFYTIIDDGNIAQRVKALFPEGVDKVLELVGIQTLKDSMQCVKKGGTLCLTGMLSEEWAIKDFSPMEYIPPMVKFTTYGSSPENISAEILQDFIDNVKAGQIELNVDQVFMLKDIVKAHEYMESNQATGKIVVLTAENQ
ncbi:MAG: zinc-binding alcohol dehydrogenase family protein [Mucilaginibacter sp.]|uniref:zinc-binding alcohol dehydrogenase family protein n=1 Tax=Mucilaginibacter sp. TaxID=1882438 RepID=UPI0034E5701B